MTQSSFKINQTFVQYHNINNFSEARGTAQNKKGLLAEEAVIELRFSPPLPQGDNWKEPVCSFSLIWRHQPFKKCIIAVSSQQEDESTLHPAHSFHTPFHTPYICLEGSRTGRTNPIPARPHFPALSYLHAERLFSSFSSCQLCTHWLRNHTQFMNTFISSTFGNHLSNASFKVASR